MKTKHPQADRDAWIMDWFKTNHSADSLNKEFHDAYLIRFPGYAQTFKMWGASPVRQAMQDLRRLAKSGLLKSGRYGMAGAWQPGFPTSVVSYSLYKP